MLRKGPLILREGLSARGHQFPANKYISVPFAKSTGEPAVLFGKGSLRMRSSRHEPPHKYCGFRVGARGFGTVTWIGFGRLRRDGYREDGLLRGRGPVGDAPVRSIAASVVCDGIRPWLLGFSGLARMVSGGGGTLLVSSFFVLCVIASTPPYSPGLCRTADSRIASQADSISAQDSLRECYSACLRAR